MSSESYHVPMEALSYICDFDLVIAILFIIRHYHEAKVIAATEYERVFKLTGTNESSFTVDIYGVECNPQEPF